MKIKFHKHTDENCVYDDSYPKIRIAGRGFLRIRKRNGAFVTKDGRTFTSIHIGILEGAPWEMTLGHEISHLLLCKYDDSERYIKDRYYYVRHEVMVERLAKSIIKPEYWNERDSKATIAWIVSKEKKNGSDENRTIDIDKLKIIPLNKGIRISQDGRYPKIR